MEFADKFWAFHAIAAYLTEQQSGLHYNMLSMSAVLFINLQKRCQQFIEIENGMLWSAAKWTSMNLNDYSLKKKG